MLAGISKSTSKMANKGGRYELAADEALVVIAMFEAVWLRKNIAILSFDNDVFIQFFKIISLMAEDYLSYLIALDYQTQPERYSKRYDLAMYHDFDTMISDKSKSFAITKPRDGHTISSLRERANRHNAQADRTTGNNVDTMPFRIRKIS